MDENLLSAIENAIIARLQPELQAVKVLPFPEDLSEFAKPVAGRHIYVGFQSESSDAPQQLNPDAQLNQVDTLSFELVFRIKNLRSHQGSLPILRQVRGLLTGFQPHPETKSLYQTRAGFVSLEQGFWIYSATYNVRSVFVHRPR